MILLAATVSYLAYPGKTVSAGRQVPAPVKQPGLVAGRVEPLSEEIKIASELDGKLKAVLVEEGQTVRKGQIIATLQSSEYAARIELAAALGEGIGSRPSASTTVPVRKNVVKRTLPFAKPKRCSPRPKPNYSAASFCLAAERSPAPSTT